MTSSSLAQRSRRLTGGWQVLGMVGGGPALTLLSQGTPSAQSLLLPTLARDGQGQGGISGTTPSPAAPHPHVLQV